jgi:GxxExxY protein
MSLEPSLKLAHSEISHEIIASFLHVFNKLGGQLPEPIYANAMPVALRMRGLHVRCEVPFLVTFEGVTVGRYRVDLIVEDKFLVELKSTEKIARVHEAQVYNYLRITRLPVGLLLNFGSTPQHRRLVIPVSARSSFP